MTPRMVKALQKRRIKRLQREDFLFAQLNATTANHGFVRFKEWVTADRYMIHPLKRREEKKKDWGDKLWEMFGRFEQTNGK